VKIWRYNVWEKCF